MNKISDKYTNDTFENIRHIENFKKYQNTKIGEISAQSQILWDLTLRTYSYLLL